MPPRARLRGATLEALRLHHPTPTKRNEVYMLIKILLRLL